MGRSRGPQAHRTTPWTEQVEHLARRFRCVTVDLPATARATRRRGRRVADAADTVAEVILDGPGRARVVGHCRRRAAGPSRLDAERPALFTAQIEASVDGDPLPPALVPVPAARGAVRPPEPPRPQP